MKSELFHGSRSWEVQDPRVPSEDLVLYCNVVEQQEGKRPPLEETKPEG